MSIASLHQVDVPPELLHDSRARELARIWSSHGRAVCVLDVAHEEDPATWGVVALDLMKHAARAYCQLDGRPEEEAYHRILAGFAAEMQHPTEML